MEIDWILLTYLFIGFFAVVGFIRGWWKEAISTFILAFLIMLLQRPDWAGVIINFVNWAIATIWQFLVDLLGSVIPSEPFQIDPTSGGAWVVILFLLLGFSVLITRVILPGDTKKVPGKFYTVGPIGRLLGLFLGALNGFLILGLFREYLDGRALPGHTFPDTEITVVGSSSFGQASTNISVQAVNLPNGTILDSYIPWLIIGIGILIFFAALKNRIRVLPSKDGRKLDYTPPYGYKVIKAEKPKEKSPIESLLGG